MEFSVISVTKFEIFLQKIFLDFFISVTYKHYALPMKTDDADPYYNSKLASARCVCFVSFLSYFLSFDLSCGLSFVSFRFVSCRVFLSFCFSLFL